LIYGFGYDQSSTVDTGRQKKEEQNQQNEKFKTLGWIYIIKEMKF
jgi:hypothetical protein